jgi:hypothetical protein
MSPLTFGDFARTVKPIPNIPLHTTVQISAVGVFKGRVSYMAVVRADDSGSIVEQIGPYPEMAFSFRARPKVEEYNELILWLSKEGN